jgi:hypothetical protein
MMLEGFVRSRLDELEGLVGDNRKSVVVKVGRIGKRGSEECGCEGEKDW